jgi:hypothetical protein
MSSPYTRGAPPPLPPLTDERRALLDIHLAEYQGLTARITNWTSIQYVSYSVLAAVITLMVQASGVGYPMKIGGGCLLVLLCVWAWSYSTWEILNTALYLEGSLRHEIRELLPGRSLLGWESYLARPRKVGYSKYERQFALFVLVMLLLATIGWLIYEAKPNFREVSSYLPSSIPWIVVDAYVCTLLILRLRAVSKVREALERVATSNSVSQISDKSLPAQQAVHASSTDLDSSATPKNSKSASSRCSPE